MFGYVKPNMPELRVREKQRYEAWYCGLCRRIGKRCGRLPRLLLSYDSAFLAMLLSAVALYPSPCTPHPCPVRPFAKKKLMIDAENPALDYAADVCMILAKFKLDDDVRDGRPMRAAARLPFLMAFKKAKKRREELYLAVENGIMRLSKTEEEKEPSIDLAANDFGEIMRSIFDHAPLGESDTEANRAALSEFGFWLGRTIYYIDAWDDREKDQKCGLYNPFNLCSSTREEAEYAVNYSINSAISAYNLLESAERHSDLAIAENILHEGFFAVWDSIDSGEKKRGA